MTCVNARDSIEVTEPIIANTTHHRKHYPCSSAYLDSDMYAKPKQKPAQPPWGEQANANRETNIYIEQRNVKPVVAAAKGMESNALDTRQERKS